MLELFTILFSWRSIWWIHDETWSKICGACSACNEKYFIQVSKNLLLKHEWKEWQRFCRSCYPEQTNKVEICLYPFQRRMQLNVSEMLPFFIQNFGQKNERKLKHCLSHLRLRGIWGLGHIINYSQLWQKVIFQQTQLQRTSVNYLIVTGKLLSQLVWKQNWWSQTGFR